MFLTCLWCLYVTGSCRQNKQCCRSPFRRSPKWTSACRWRTRSCCGSSITETWVARARCHPPPPPPRPTPSASSRLEPPACSPALLCHPDNDGLLLQRSRASSFFFFLRYPPGIKSHVCFFFAWQQSPTVAPSGLDELWQSLYRDAIDCWKMGKKEKRKKSCTEALKQGHLVVCLSRLMVWMGRERKSQDFYVCNETLFLLPVFGLSFPEAHRTHTHAVNAVRKIHTCLHISYVLHLWRSQGSLNSESLRVQMTLSVFRAHFIWNMYAISHS